MSQQENIYELPLFKAHVLLLADIVADFSGRTELAKKRESKRAFSSSGQNRSRARCSRAAGSR